MPCAWNLEHASLICRTTIFKSSKSSGVIETLPKKQCDSQSYVSGDILRVSFRGQTRFHGSIIYISPEEDRYSREEKRRVNHQNPFGFHCPIPTHCPIPIAQVAAEIIDSTQKRITIINRKRYTLFDAFCGAGGTARGAKAAGLMIKGGFDHDPAAIETWLKNFTRAHCWAGPAHKFIIVNFGDFKVDVLHFSPPCQPYSPVYTRAGQYDENNQAMFLAIEGILKKTKTIETHAKIQC